MLKRLAPSVLVVGALAMVGTAVAGRGGASKPSSSWISEPLVVSSTTSATDSVGPSYGDTITFDVSTALTTNPFVNVRCFQNGEVVLDAWSAFFAGGLGDGTFGLGSPAWQSGAAAYTANLDMYANGRWKLLASTSFHVEA